MKFFSKMKTLMVSAIALAASVSVAAATCISGCEGSGLTWGGAAYFQGVTGGSFTAPTSGSGLITSDKWGSSNITVDIVDGGFCEGADCTSIALNGQAEASEHGWTNGSAEGAESGEAVAVNTGGLFGAGSALNLVYNGVDQTALATGGAMFSNSGGGQFTGDTGGVNVTSYGTGGVNTDVGYVGDACGFDCGDITGAASAYGTAGMMVDAFGSTALSDFEVLVQNGGSSFATVGTNTGVTDNIGQ